MAWMVLLMWAFEALGAVRLGEATKGWAKPRG